MAKPDKEVESSADEMTESHDIVLFIICCGGIGILVYVPFLSHFIERATAYFAIFLGFVLGGTVYFPLAVTNGITSSNIGLRDDVNWVSSLRLAKTLLASFRAALFDTKWFGAMLGLTLILSALGLFVFGEFSFSNLIAFLLADLIYISSGLIVGLGYLFLKLNLFALFKRE